ncbi:hypothetical protein BC793_15424 [Actinoplanes xinjiangensis]|uniref:Uncharacterized protein n=1 Tax=Actinoplanes xinjiangensis TaxID=512350 RepID=A0A316EC46_9ACTN|nr:hypothetical protein BC793_15424 [Actinoplanes xinjiangensis]
MCAACHSCHRRRGPDGIGPVAPGRDSSSVRVASARRRDAPRRCRGPVPALPGPLSSAERLGATTFTAAVAELLTRESHGLHLTDVFAQGWHDPRLAGTAEQAEGGAVVPAVMPPGADAVLLACWFGPAPEARPGVLRPVFDARTEALRSSARAGRLTLAGLCRDPHRRPGEGGGCRAYRWGQICRRCGWCCFGGMPALVVPGPNSRGYPGAGSEVAVMVADRCGHNDRAGRGCGG